MVDRIPRKHKIQKYKDILFALVKTFTTKYCIFQFLSYLNLENAIHTHKYKNDLLNIDA